MKRAFTRNLVEWHYAYNKRIMPWKGIKDPYKIWLSEIILQQTRVEQGLPYYNAFVTQFPTVQKLAAANDEVVFKLWEGLGYYSRCKNLLSTARTIVAQREGKFPDTYEDLIKLKGIGPYTASAISSFAYGLPNAVVDGNVFRVLARYFGISIEIDSTEGKKYFNTLAQTLLKKEDSAAYNQAIMDFGAGICKPQTPNCSQCILSSHCVAFNKGMVSKLPIKGKRLVKKERWFYYFIFEFEDQVFVSKRTAKDIWENLNEFFLWETAKPEKWNTRKLGSWLKEELDISKSNVHNVSEVYKQQLTHQVIYGQFIQVKLTTVPKKLSSLQFIDREKIKDLPFPKFINQHLQLINHTFNHSQRA